jgi:hypothetical protein
LSKEKKSDAEIFATLAEKLGVTVSEIEAEYKKLVEETKKDERFLGLDDAGIAIIARNRFITQKIREARSPAITWEGVVLGIGDLIDSVARQKRATEEAFKADPQGTIAGTVFDDGRGKRQVLSDESGTPLYPFTEINKRFKRAGKPLPDHDWLRTIVGVAAPIKDKKVGMPKPFTMALRGRAAVEPKIVMNKPVRFKGIDKTRPEDAAAGEYRIGWSAYTNFEVATDLKLPPLETVIREAAQSKYVPLGELEEYHLKSRNTPNRWLITEGSVELLVLEPVGVNQNYRMVIYDESLLFKEKEMIRAGVTCWIPSNRGIELDFGRDSRVFVVGKSGQSSTHRDLTTGEIINEPGDVTINVYGIYSPEFFKVKAKPVTEKTFESVLETPEPSSKLPEAVEEEESDEW